MDKLKEKIRGFKSNISNVFRKSSNTGDHSGEPSLKTYYVAFKEGTNEKKQLAYIEKYILLDKSYGEFTGFEKSGVYDLYVGNFSEIALAKIKKLRSVLEATDMIFELDD